MGLFNNSIISQKRLEWLFHQLFLLVILFFSISFGVFLRGQHTKELQGKYLITVDAYRHVRHARQIVEEGEIPRVDKMRYYPDGVDNATRPMLFPWLLSSAYRIVHQFAPRLTFHQVMIYYPVIVFACLCLFLFFFARKLFGYWAALQTIILFPVMPVLIQQFYVGYTDTDALILLLFLVSLYCYYMAWSSLSVKNKIIYSLFSGFAIGILGLAWLGNGICSLVILGFNLLVIWKERFNKRDCLVVFLWAVSILLLLLGFTPTYTHLRNTYTLLAIGLPALNLILAASFLVIQPLLFDTCAEVYQWVLYCPVSSLEQQSAYALSYMAARGSPD